MATRWLSSSATSRSALRSLPCRAHSMATPQVANLAAKLFALDPSLTAGEARKLIIEGATPSEDGKRPRLNPKRSVELLTERAANR